MDISTLSITELKAAAYDQIVELQKVQRNIALIEAEIAKKQNEHIPAPITSGPEEE